MGELFLFTKYNKLESVDHVSGRVKVAGLVKDEPIRFSIGGVFIEIVKGFNPGTLQVILLSSEDGQHPKDSLEIVDVGPLGIAHMRLYGRHRAEVQILATGVTDILGE